MKKHKIELSYKDLHAIKHALESRIAERREVIFLRQNAGISTENYIPDLEHEIKLLERINERINEIKDLYKIK